MNLMELLQRPIAGMPLWLWAGVVGGGGIALAIYLRRRGGTSGGTLGQNAAGQQQVTDPNIDPFTGVPYTIESQINPATGLPAYYGGPGVDQGITASPSSTPTPVDQHIAVDPLPPFAGHQFAQSVSAGQQWNAQQMYPVVQFPARSGGARGPYQATPWWPAMTDLADLSAGREG